MIKFLSLEERITEFKAGSQKDKHSQSVVITSLNEQFEQFRSDSQLKNDIMMKIVPDLADKIRDENR